MNNDIDGFVFPIHKTHLREYKKAAEKVAEIWKEYSPLAYFEFVGDNLFLEGTNSFVEAMNAEEDEKIVLGWIVYPSK